MLHSGMNVLFCIFAVAQLDINLTTHSSNEKWTTLQGQARGRGQGC